MAMDVSNNLLKQECMATALARRLQEQNEFVSLCGLTFGLSTDVWSPFSRLLDLLLDMNQMTKMPPHLRFDLRSPSPSAPSDRENEPDMDPATAKLALREAEKDLSRGHLSVEEFTEIESQLTERIHPPYVRKLSSLLRTPHTPYTPVDIPSDLKGDDPAGYFNPSHEEEHLAALDAALADPHPSADDVPGRPILPPESTRTVPSDKDLAFRNPDSAYNWLRRYQPQVFLQDHQPASATAENASDKAAPPPAAHHHRGSISAGAPGAAPASGSANGPSTNHPHTGGRKRGGARASNASAAAARDADPDALDDEAGYAEPPPPPPPSGGRRRKVEDEAYRPKGGSSRPAKRKRESGGDGERGGGSARKKAARGSMASNASAG